MPQPPAEDAAPAIVVERLTVTGFRNYRRASLAADRRPVLLIGPNGAGKTNLLEALSFLAPGRGLRRAALDAPCRRAGPREPCSGGWAVAARLAAASEAVEIGTGVAAADGAEAPQRRIVRIDGVDAASQSVLAQWVALSWLTPEMDRLFDGPAAERRRFLDRLATGFDGAHAARLSRYERSMRERARLLRGDGPRAEAAWLDALERAMAETGVAVAAARRALARRLDAACRTASGAFPGASVAVAGEVERMLDDAPALAVEDEVRMRLARSRQADGEAGRTLFGPHRSDLSCADLAGGRPAAACSTGEQKALLIRIVLGHARLVAAERGSTPLLLLDEIAAHLDDRRREALFAELLALGGQAWMTGTGAAEFAALGDRAQRLAVRDGRISDFAAAA